MPNEQMNPETDKIPGAPKISGSKDILHHLLRILKKNWGLKVGCIVMAVCLWGGLIAQDATLVRQKQINDVSINVLNADTLLRNGFIVVSGLEDEKLTGAWIKVEVPQRYYSQVTASNYNVRVDLSRIRSAGEQTLTVTTTSSSAYGSVIDMSVKQLTVVVEEYVPRSRIPVRIEKTGEEPDGFYAEAAGVDPLYIEIAGPKSQVERVVNCVALYDMSLLSPSAGMQRFAVPLELHDQQGGVIALDDIDIFTGGVLIDSITVEQTLYSVMELPVSTVGLTSGQPKSGYEVKGIIVEPAYIKIAFLDNSNALTHLFPATTIDISGADGPISAPISIIRPTGTKNMRPDQVSVTVDIGPIGSVVNE